MNNNNSQPCHFYHVGSCKNNKCEFSHQGMSLGKCPNGKNCNLPHSKLQCPVIKQGLKCKNKDCEYKHKINQPQEINIKRTYQQAEQYQHSNDQYQQKGTQYLYDQITKKIVSVPVKKELDKEVILQNRKWEEKGFVLANSKQQEDKEYTFIVIDAAKQPKTKNIFDPSSNKNQQIPEFTVEQPISLKKYDSYQQKLIEGAKEEFIKNLSLVQSDLHLIQKYQQNILSQTDLDLMIILDCTATMSDWIKACKDELAHIVEYVRKENQISDIRISFIGYRDHGDYPNQFSIHPFTTDIPSIEEFIKDTIAFGGGDEPEDLCGALDEALKQNWQAKARYAILICDAPCHGKQYHILDDNYPEGDPKGRIPEKQIQKLAKLNISFAAIKISNQTNQMFNILSQAYQSVTGKSIEFADLGKSTVGLGYFIAYTVADTVNNAILVEQTQILQKLIQFLKAFESYQQQDEKQKQELNINANRIHEYIDQIINQVKQELKEKNKIQIENYQKKQQSNEAIKLQLVNDVPIWNDLYNSCTLYFKVINYFISEDYSFLSIQWNNLQVSTSEIKTKIRISLSPFQLEQSKYSFYAYDKVLLQKIIIKVPNVIDEDYNIDKMKYNIENVVVSQYIMNHFNNRIIDFLPDMTHLINCKHSYLYENIPICNRQYKFKYYYAEHFIQRKNDKYNNISGWHNRSSSVSQLLQQAFAHFSWQFTKGFLLIDDIQVTTGTITDPQIHTLDKIKFGSRNLGYEGILRFFVNHQCNYFCKKLQLVHPVNFISKTQTSLEFFQDKIQEPEDKYKKVNALCDLCKKPFMIEAGELYLKKYNCQEMFCKFCENKKQKTQKLSTCLKCLNSFSSSKYYFSMKFQEFPDKCQQCRKNQREQALKTIDKTSKPTN